MDKFYGLPWRIAFHTTEENESTPWFDIVSDDTLDTVAAELTRENAERIVCAVNEQYDNERNATSAQREHR